MFRHAADRMPISVIMALFAVDLAVYALVDAPAWLLLWTLVGIIPKAHVCAWNHHHQHSAVFSRTWQNRLLELVYALQTGVTSQAWMLHHTIGHHTNYRDQALDEARWLGDDGRAMGAARFTLVTTLTAYPRAWRVGRDYPKIRRTFTWMLVVTLALLALLVSLRPLPALFVFVLPMAISLVVTVWATHSHHTGNSTESHFVASNNITAPAYNILTGNLGYHTAHHLKPGVHWSKLPGLHARIANQIPETCYLPAWYETSRRSSVRDEIGGRGLSLEDAIEPQPDTAG
jgi:fatty acid desaturase